MIISQLLSLHYEYLIWIKNVSNHLMRGFMPVLETAVVFLIRFAACNTVEPLLRAWQINK